MAAKPESFAAILRREREGAELSREQLADAAGITRESVRLYETGERRPTWTAVQAIAKALNLPTDTFRDS